MNPPQKVCYRETIFSGWRNMSDNNFQQTLPAGTTAGFAGPPLCADR